VSEYDYGNARLRARKSRLLSRHDLELLSETGSLQSLITALLRTPYRKSIETALARITGIDCITEALRNDLVESMKTIHGFYAGNASEMIAMVMRYYDIHNLKAILRGLGKNVAPGEIIPTLLPIGDLSYNLLADVARAQSPRIAIDLLASMNYPIVHPLLKLRVARPGADTFEMEMALEQWYFQEARKDLPGEDEAEQLLLSALNMDADLTNLLVVLRFVADPAEKRLLQQRLGTDRLSSLFVGPGRLSFKLLTQAGEQDLLLSALTILEGSVFSSALKSGYQAYSQTGRLSSLEKSLHRYRLSWMVQWIAKDPLGLGVFLGYLALKISEIANIRWIARGINLGLTPDILRSELDFTS